MKTNFQGLNYLGWSTNVKGQQISGVNNFWEPQMFGFQQIFGVTKLFEVENLWGQTFGGRKILGYQYFFEVNILCG